MAANDTFGWASSEQSLVAPHMEYMRKNRWILDFAGLPAGLVSAYAGGAGASLRLNCSKAARPKITFEDTEVKRLNGSIYLAGKPKFETMAVSFYDALKLSAGITSADGMADPLAPSPSDIMEGWRELIYQPNKGDAFGSAGNYKGFAYLHMLEPISMDPVSEGDGPTKFDPTPAGPSITQSWLIQGMFPQGIEYGELDYGSSDVQEVSVTFRYDRAYRVQKKTAISA